MVFLLSYLDEGLEALVFGHQVLVEVHSFIVAAAEPFVHPLHGFPVGPWELRRTRKAAAAGQAAKRQDESSPPPNPSYLGDQDISYPADDEASVRAPPLQLALPLPLEQAEEVLRVEIHQVIQHREELLHRRQVHLQLLLQAFAVHLRHDA